MDNTTAAVTTVMVVTAGRWADGKGLEARVVVGGGVYMIMLSVISSSEPKFAGQIATLVLVGALLTYAVPLFEKMGFNSAAPPPVPTTGKFAPPGTDKTMQRTGRT